MKFLLLYLTLQFGWVQEFLAQEPFKITSWKILGPFMAAPRDGSIDHLERHGGEKEIIPSEQQVFYSLYPPKGELRWREIEVDSEQVEIKYDGIDWNSS